jgi:hypothetical protein
VSGIARVAMQGARRAGVIAQRERVARDHAFARTFCRKNLDRIGC